MRRVASISTVLVLVLFAGVALAEKIPNWAAPSTWTPPVRASTGGVKTALSTTYWSLPFIPLTPCRLADTRSGSGFSGQWGPPSIAGGGTQRTFTITGQCGIPTGAQAVSFNFAVWGPPTRGDLRVFPAGGGTPLVSTLNWEAGILALANAAVVPLGAGGAITLQVDGAGTVDIFFDVNGYYSPDVSQSSYGDFYISTNAAYYGAIVGYNSNPLGYGVRGMGAGAGIGVYGTSGSGPGVKGDSFSGFGVDGISTSSYGVYGASSSSVGIYGYSATGADGVFGKSGDSYGAGVHGQLTASVGSSTAVWGEHQATGSSGIGVMGSHAGAGYGVFGASYGATGAGAKGVYGYAASDTDGTIGVYGYQGASTGKSYGVYGFGNSTSANAAAVRGISDAPTANTSSWTHTGVRGESATGNGVLGMTANNGSLGVVGIQVNSSGTVLTEGFLGDFGYGVYYIGGLAGTGTKSFVEPHATDGTKEIRYVALEGPEAGTYFRGRGRFVGGRAVIEVPETFRTVTDPEGITVQVTPIGRAAAVGVISIGLDQIEVEGPRDVEFSYLVQGVRHAYKDFRVVVDSHVLRPRSADARMPLSLSEVERERLIATGVYNADGTVNMEMAERAGWAKEWREAEQARQQRISRAPQEQTAQQ